MVPKVNAIHEDHPREYGENKNMLLPGGLTKGSSPRIRGEFYVFCFDFDVRGIIPANTGRIYIVSNMQVNSGDHPREYGENAHEIPEGYRNEGSSPRIRGECDLFMPE